MQVIDQCGLDKSSLAASTTSVLVLYLITIRLISSISESALGSLDFLAASAADFFSLSMDELVMAPMTLGECSCVFNEHD